MLRCTKVALEPSGSLKMAIKKAVRKTVKAVDETTTNAFGANFAEAANDQFQTVFNTFSESAETLREPRIAQPMPLRASPLLRRDRVEAGAGKLVLDGDHPGYVLDGPIAADGTEERRRIRWSPTQSDGAGRTQRNTLTSLVIPADRTTGWEHDGRLQSSARIELVQELVDRMMKLAALESPPRAVAGIGILIDESERDAAQPGE